MYNVFDAYRACQSFEGSVRQSLGASVSVERGYELNRRNQNENNHAEVSANNFNQGENENSGNSIKLPDQSSENQRAVPEKALREEYYEYYKVQREGQVPYTKGFEEGKRDDINQGENGNIRDSFCLLDHNSELNRGNQNENNNQGENENSGNSFCLLDHNSELNRGNQSAVTPAGGSEYFIVQEQQHRLDACNFIDREAPDPCDALSSNNNGGGNVNEGNKGAEMAKAIKQFQNNYNKSSSQRAGKLKSKESGCCEKCIIF